MEANGEAGRGRVAARSAPRDRRCGEESDGSAHEGARGRWGGHDHAGHGGAHVQAGVVRPTGPGRPTASAKQQDRGGGKVRRRPGPPRATMRPSPRPPSATSWWQWRRPPALQRASAGGRARARGCCAGQCHFRIDRGGWDGGGRVRRGGAQGSRVAPGRGGGGTGGPARGMDRQREGGAEWRGLRVRDGGGPGNGDGQPTGGRGRRPPRLVGLASPQGGGGAANGVASSTPAAPGWRHASSHAPADGSRGAVPQPRNAVARAPARGRRWWWVGERALSVRGLDRIDPVPGLDHSIHAINSSEKMICCMGWPRNCTSQV